MSSLFEQYNNKMEMKKTLNRSLMAVEMCLMGMIMAEDNNSSFYEDILEEIKDIEDRVSEV